MLSYICTHRIKACGYVYDAQNITIFMRTYSLPGLAT